MNDLDHMMGEEEYLSKSIKGEIEDLLNDYTVVVNKGSNHLDIKINGINIFVYKNSDKIDINLTEEKAISMSIKDFTKLVDLIKKYKG